MFQPAVSSPVSNILPSGVMEETEVCSLPGGVAGVRKQFESQATKTSHVTQLHFHHRAVQETTSSEVTVSSSRQSVQSSQQLNFSQASMVSHSESNMESSYNNHEAEEEEDYSKYTTKELRAHFERTIEEAAPPKPIKIVRDINRAKWSSNATQSNTVTTEVCDAPAVEAPEETVMDFEDFPPPPEDPDYLPPPPPDLLEMPNDAELIPECHYSPEPPANSKCPLDRETYVKQRRMNELKRLYKHIHPEVRKNIEKECTVCCESANNKVESHEYVYEYDSDDMCDDEEGEWEEILPGEVQAMRWRFENKPLDAIKDVTPEEVDGNGNAIEQEMILGKDVRRTAWMFETKSMDVAHNTNTTEYKNKFNKLDKGDVRAAAWLFETQAMDSLNKMHKEEDLTKEIVFTEEDGDATIYMIDNKYMESLGHTETIDESRLLSLRTVLEEINGEVKTVTSTFDTQFRCIIMGQSSQMLEIKSVRKIETELESSIASRWLFDTQPLDMTSAESSPLWLICSLSMEDGSKGDWGRWLFEIKTLNSIHEWESNVLDKKVVGADVRKHCMVFETQSMDTLKDDSNARNQTIEDIIGGNVRSARNFFENSPTVERKNLLDVGKLKKTVADEEVKGDVRHQKWRFESQPLEHIREDKKQVTRTVNIETDLTQEDGTSCRADVRKNCWVFETQPMDTLKDDSNTQPMTKEEVIAGNVRSARNYFETNQGDELKELAEVGKLKKRVALEEEKGDVRHQKWRFESQPLEQIREERKEVIRTIDLEEIDKVDVSNYKHIFESSDLSTRDESQKIAIEGVAIGSVKSNKDLFESNQLYAMQDSFGRFHEVTTVRREEVMKGDVQTCKWMFETRPIDQFDENISEYQIIKGISKEEIESGDVKTAKWLFETQPLDAIKYFSNIEDEEVVIKSADVTKGDVKTCKWLFETKPMDVLYDKVEVENGNLSEEMPKGDVKTSTWLFETQALDEIHDESETVLKTCTVREEDIRGKDVRKACFLFETEKLENLSGEEAGSYKRVTEIDIESGDVSKMKYIFENQSSEIMTSTSEANRLNLKRVQMEDIQRGNVVNCKWRFENQDIDTIHDSQEESISRTVIDVHGGDVNKGRLIFETNSLDKIHEVSSDLAMMKTQRIVREEDEKGDVRNYTMMFETQPLYAIQDKEGHYHEVTTVTSEEVTHGDVVGARWLFETKPLDAIKDTDEVYVIKSVTQQDVQKGDVTSAKWKFETQPLDRIAEGNRAQTKTVDDIQGGNVQINKQRFESDAVTQNSVRTVNVSEIQKGDVRSAKWRFETQSIDKIRSMSSENLIETVKKEDVAKGDVKQSVWLFEKNPLDHIKELNEDEAVAIEQEEIPKADVKTTTWLFETKPFGNFNEATTEKTEIVGKSVKRTLEELYSQKMVTSKGILIETDEIGDVRMAKYHLMNQQAPEIQREQVIRGDLQTIMMNLLNKQERMERQVVVDSEEKGNISSTVQQLFNQERDSSVEREEILRGNIQKAIDNLFDNGGAAKHGILIQEDEKGDVKMTIYSLMNKEENAVVEKEDIIRGDIKSALQSLADSNRQDLTKIRVDDSEKGNVNFYSTCIESGALNYLKELNSEESEEVMAEKEKIIGGDVKGTKYILSHNQTQVERTVEDVIPGDVQKGVQVFTSEQSFTSDGLLKEEIVRGDLKAALSSLSESAKHTVVVEKEEVVKGNIPKALRCLERAQHRHKEVEKPDIIRGNIKGALRSLEKSVTAKVEAVVDDLVPGDVKATLKSLEMAKKTVREVEKEEIIRGDIHMAMQSLQDANVDKVKCQQEIDVQGDVKGTIQLLLEPPPSPKMQRRPSVDDDIRGDVKMSIKSLYEGQEQTQVEKEEIIKGDVKGKIKSLMETAQRETPKVRMKAYRRMKQRPPVKNLNADAQRNVQKIKTAKPVETENLAGSSRTESTEVKSSTVTRSTTQCKCSVEHKTITQNHGIKTVKTQFRNLNSKQKGTTKSDKTKVETDVYKLKAPESDLPLPPPPPPVADSDMLPPPPPPCIDSEIDALPPPPPPLTNEPDFLPPPPSQQELESIPAQSPAKAKKMTVKKVNGPVLCPVPKLEKKVEFNKSQEVKTESVVHIRQSKITTDASKRASAEIPPPPESPKPVHKVSISPVRFTPPPSPTPSVKGKPSKFNTPLIKAEEKFKKMREESTPPTTPTPPPPLSHETLSSALDLVSSTETTQNRLEIPQTVSEICSKTQSGVVSKQVAVSGTTQRSVSHKKEVMQTHSSVTSKQKTVSKKEVVSTVRQETTQISMSSKQSQESIKTQHIQTEVSGAAENMTADVIKEQKTNVTSKSENVVNQENVSSDKKLKAAKSPERQKKVDESQPKDQEKQSASNGKSGKNNQKGKKNGKQAEKQVDIKAKNESVKQVEVSVAAEVNVHTAPQVEKTETKPEITVESTSLTSISDAAVVVEIVAENKPESAAPAKKKKKSKKSRASKEGVAESSAIKAEAKENVQQVNVLAPQSDIKEVKKESVVKSKECQSDQKVITAAKGKSKKEDTASPKSEVGSEVETQVIPVTQTSVSEKAEVKTSTTVREEKQQHVQMVKSHTREVQEVSVTQSLNTECIITSDLSGGKGKQEAVGSSHKEPESISVRDTNEKQKREYAPESVGGRASPRISKISIGSAKVENHVKTTTTQEKRKDESSQSKALDLRAPSPSLRMRSPSPTFITIESTRRTDSPQRVCLSPTLLHRPGTPPTPPPRRCETPSRLTRITPSPTFDKAENLARLKDTTAKLSRGVTPPPPLYSQQITEKKSEIVELPASFQRQIKVESQTEVTSQTEVKEVHAASKNVEIVSESFSVDKAKDASHPHSPTYDLSEDDSELSSASVREKREFFEGAQKAEINKTYVRKEPIDIPERLGPDTEECEDLCANKEKDEQLIVNLSSLVNKFESKEEKSTLGRGILPEFDLNDLIRDLEEDITEHHMPTFDIQAMRDVFELGKMSYSDKDEKLTQEESVSTLTTEDFSKLGNTPETKELRRQLNSLPEQKKEEEKKPEVRTETKSVTERFSDFDEFGNLVSGTRTAVTTQSASSSTQQVPFSYADAVKRKTAAARRTETYDEDATEKLLQNFHKTWMETETVFKSLGYTVSEERAAQSSHQTTVVSSGSSTKVGAVHSLPEEGLSDGWSDSGQKKVP